MERHVPSGSTSISSWGRLCIWYDPGEPTTKNNVSIEHRRKSSPDRQSESDVSWRKKGGGPCALVTPPVVVDSWSEVFSADDEVMVVAIIPSRIGREDILIVLLLFVCYLLYHLLSLLFV